MATEQIKIIGQQAPGANTAADLTSPASGHFQVVSSIIACNTGAAGAKIRLHARQNGAGTGIGNALVYDYPIGPGMTEVFQFGVTLATNDILTCRSDVGTVSFTAFGSDVG